MSDDVTRGLHLDRGRLSDQIYDHIKMMIKTGALAPGDRVVESTIARSLGVSQAPVREALKRLVHDGLATNVSHLGTFVAEYSREEADDARAARVALEGMAARIVGGRVDESLHARLSSLIEQMRVCAERGDIAGFRELDFAFHRAVITASDNVYLPRMWDIVEPSLRSMHVLSDPNYDGDWMAMADSHNDLLDALEAGDPGAAGDLFVRHAMGRSRYPDGVTGFDVRREVSPSAERN